MKEWIMNTSWSCTPKGYVLVGCDGRHTLLCRGCEYATERGWQCELPVNQGGTTEDMLSVLI